MIILDLEKSNSIRQKYIQSFVDTSSNYYIGSIKTMRQFSDGLCYIGYLWDCLKKPKVTSKYECEHFLLKKNNLYIMWDIHSADRIFIPNYWKFPKSNILFVDKWIPEIYKELPEDIYIFDNSFTWSVVYTHEINLHNEQYCLYLDL